MKQRFLDLVVTEIRLTDCKVLWELKMNRTVMLRLASVMTLGILLSVFAFPPVQASGGKEVPVPPAIRITPPAPVFDDAKRRDELAARRKHVAETIGPKAVL